MQSNAASVEEYIAEAPSERQEALQRLRAMCLDLLTGYREIMAYGMPAYARGEGEGGVAFASQKQYISLYITKVDAATIGKSLVEGKRGVSYGKGCFRYVNPKYIDFDIVEAMLKATAASNTVSC